MKIRSQKDELKQMSDSKLASKIDELRRDLLTLRLQSATSPVKDLSSRKRTLKRMIACGLTLLKQSSNKQIIK